MRGRRRQTFQNSAREEALVSNASESALIGLACDKETLVFTVFVLIHYLINGSLKQDFSSPHVVHILKRDSKA